ncbi:helix-turn-helix transcriptional regulator [Bradyrhizobium jicamae]|uniref:Helix-turn-helix transcriptional regulator n=1 Tax=Bradyrhizobium jicamae TaxID=280332 RepID=A0ABS5FPP7_9BRAD|nr:helix-turn-helix transcriptional regulator [Bradyrhizobium jicamae]MBR0798731.1 helix-turn-helix transcriptional regulator [Bradyrhizobium jicamae]
MVDLRKLDDVTARLGDVVLDPAGWPSFMDEVCAAVGATGAAMLQSDIRTEDIPRTESITDYFSKTYFPCNLHLTDVRAARGVPRLLAGADVVTDADLFGSEAEMLRDPLYASLGEFGLKWFAAVGFRAGSALWGLTIQRSPKEGMFDTDEVKALSTLSARLTEAATLSTIVGRSAISGITNALDLIQIAAIAVGRFGAVIGMNSQAEACLGHDLVIRNNRLTLHDRQAHADLSRLIDQLRHTSDLLTLPSAPIVMRRIDKRPIVIQMQPVPPAARSPFLGARAILLIRDLESNATFDQNLLVATFELTPAQARLAAILARGGSVEDAAQATGISTATARNHLKAIFQKTGTHRQAELVALLHLVK